MTNLDDQLTGLQTSRRSVVRGAAWSVPVVAVAATAPAFAASPCDVQAYRLNWGTSSYTPPPLTGATRVGTATATPSGATGGGGLTVTFSSVVFGSTTRADDNMTVSTETNIGNLGTGERGLNLSHTSPITAGRDNRQELSIRFNRAVTGLAFTITDIDSNGATTGNQTTDNWWDRVELTGTRTGTAVSRGNNQGNFVIGDGTNTAENSATSGPWRFYSDDVNIANVGDNSANLAVTYSGTIAANTPIVLTYWTAVSNGNQRIFISDFTFNARGC